VADYVLSGFDPVARAELPGIVLRAAEAVELVLSSGLQAAMNRVNTKSPAKSPSSVPIPAVAPKVSPAGVAKKESK